MRLTDLRRHVAFGAVLVLLASGFGVWTWNDQLASLGGDSAVYVLTARNYAPYAPPNEAASEIARGSQFPPLYPVLLALSGGAADLRFAHAATTLALVTAFAGFYAWLIALGVSAPLATVGVVVFAVLPGTLINALYLHSESLYLAFALWALAALSRAPRDGGGTATWWLAGALIAAALLTRTAGIALLPAYAVALWRSRPNGAALMFAAAVAPAAAWSLWHKPAQSYSESMLATYAEAGPAALWHSVTDNAAAVYDGVLVNWLQTTSLLFAVVGLVLASAVIGLLRMRRLEPDAWYAAAYLAILALWPYPGESVRFAWPLLPLMIGFLFSALPGRAAAAGLGVRWRPALPVLAGAVLAGIALPGAALNVQRFLHPVAERHRVLRALPEWYGADIQGALRESQRHVALAGALRAFGQEIPEGDCVLSIKPALVAFYTGRRSASPPLPSTDAAAFAAGLEAAGCEFVLLLPFSSPTFRFTLYPGARLGESAAIIAERTIWTEGTSIFKAYLVALHGGGS